MAAALREAGFSEIYCTPHLIRGSYDADNETVRKAVAGLQERLDSLGIDLRLFAGREYYLDEFIKDSLIEPLPLGKTDYLLIEVPDHVTPDYVKEVCYRIKCAGLTPMIAHPERSSHFAVQGKGEKKQFNILRLLASGFSSKSKAQNPKFEEGSLLAYLKDIGCAFQGNYGSFAGKYGERAKRTAATMREGRLYTHLGTDLHSKAGMATVFSVSGENGEKPWGVPLQMY